MVRSILILFFLCIPSLLFPTKYKEDKEYPKSQKVSLCTRSSKEVNKNKSLKNQGNKNEAVKSKSITVNQYSKKNIATVPKNSWKPYWIPPSAIEESKYLFFQANIGVGFLYFDGIRANLAGAPSSLFRDSGNIPYQGRLRYNRTPLFEFVQGYQFYPWLKVALSYQHQSAVTIFTKSINATGAFLPNGNIAAPQGQFKSNFAIDAFMLKGYLNFPRSMVWKLLAYTPYLGVGVGIGWQSWTRNEWDLSSILTANGYQGYQSSQFFLRPQFSANFIWGADLGLKIQSAFPNQHFSMRFGCKYNQWGRVRSIGKLKDQGSMKLALFKPFSVKIVYSFAPYLGVQWNIPNSSLSPSLSQIEGRNINTWKPFFVRANSLQLPKSLFAQFNGGVGFLYFAGIRGNLSMTPPDTYQVYGQFPGKYSMQYNRTPLLEYVCGFRVNPWIKLGISKQFQSGVNLNTKLVPGVNGQVPANAQLQASLNLLAAAVKVYIEIPRPMVWKNLAYTMFVAGAAGPCWQSWNRMGVAVNGFVDRPILGVNQGSGYLFPLRSKIIANPFFVAEGGVKIKTARYDVNFYMVAGCKYIYWGAARNLGKVMQQYPNYREGLFKPFNIKQLYSFAPYLGVQWDFENKYMIVTKKPYKIHNKNVDSLFPFIAKHRGENKGRPFFTQVNTGVGFLYFDHVRANLAGVPSTGVMGIFGNYPYSGKPGYNRTPLFEYLIGRSVFTWLNVAISYQYQSNVAIETATIKPTSTPTNTNLSNTRARFLANFRVDAIMPKFYITLPWSIVWLKTLSNPYIALGAGVGWQSWTRIDVQRLGVFSGSSVQMDQPICQKISANAVWTVDCGFKISSAYPDAKFATTVGVKYVQWGQALSMGRIQNQLGSVVGLFRPLSVRMVYSFAPYFGVQWNF